MGRQRKSPQEVSESRRKAGRLGLIARGVISPDAPMPDEDAAPDDAPIVLPGECPYDFAVRQRLITYNEARLREEVVAKLIENDNLRDEQAIKRGKLITKDQATERDSKLAALIIGRLMTAMDLVAGLAPPERKQEARDRAKQWISDTRKTLAAEIRAMAE
jgi:hypothetical protein